MKCLTSVGAEFRKNASPSFSNILRQVHAVPESGTIPETQSEHLSVLEKYTLHPEAMYSLQQTQTRPWRLEAVPEFLNDPCVPAHCHNVYPPLPQLLDAPELPKESFGGLLQRLLKYAQGIRKLCGKMNVPQC